MTSSSESSSQPDKPAVVVGAVLLLWLGYTTLQVLSVTGHVLETWFTFLSFIPGILGLAVLLRAGLSRDQCYLRLGRLSRQGLLVLAAVFVFALAAILPVGSWQGWNWKAALIDAPVGGVSQELFFRSVLLPAALLAFRKRPRLALLVHSALFGLWHVGPLFVGAPFWAVIAVVLVPFLSGIGWGWQVQHDRTVIWAMVQHSLIWVICLQFPMPA